MPKHTLTIEHDEREELIIEADIRIMANQMRGSRFWCEMVNSGVPLHIRRGAIRAAWDSLVGNLDEVTDYNARGGLLRDHDALQAREAMYLRMHDKGFSYPEIGKAFGVSHSTVIPAVRRRKLARSQRKETQGQAA